MDWLQIKEWFRNGIEKIKWFASLIGSRLQIEIALIKTLNSIETLRRERDGYLLRLGERVAKIKESPQHDVFTDPEIKSLFTEIERLNREIEGLRSNANDLSSLED